MTSTMQRPGGAGPAVFAFTAEHDALRTMVRDFLAARSPESEIRRLMETESGCDPAVWQELTGQLGLHALLIPERFGGAGAGFVDMQIVCEEMGSALFCAPFLGSAVLATCALLASADEVAQQRYLPMLADGSTVATVAIAETSGGWSVHAPQTRAEAERGRGERAFRLTGDKAFVLDGMLADLLLVVAATECGPSLFAVDATAAGLSRSAVPTLDATRKQARVTLSDTPAELVGIDGGAAEFVTSALDRAAAAMAAEQTGGARRVLQMAVDYAKVREQFGHPIGSYQAIKHKCADMLLESESAASAAYAAGWAIDASSEEAGVLVSLAKAYCSDAFYHCAAENIQIHGGIGFTWEHPAQLYFKRATSSRILFGGPRTHREQLLHRMGL